MENNITNQQGPGLKSLAYEQPKWHNQAWQFSILKWTPQQMDSYFLAIPEVALEQNVEPG
jgi:hypothetical protein